jgi:hypothetical protein
MQHTNVLISLRTFGMPAWSSEGQTDLSLFACRSDQQPSFAHSRLVPEYVELERSASFDCAETTQRATTSLTVVKGGGGVTDPKTCHYGDRQGPLLSTAGLGHMLTREPCLKYKTFSYHGRSSPLQSFNKEFTRPPSRHSNLWHQSHEAGAAIRA